MHLFNLPNTVLLYFIYKYCILYFKIKSVEHEKNHLHLFEISNYKLLILIKHGKS